GIDQPLRKMETVFVGKGDQGSLVDQRAEQRFEVSGDGCVIGLGPFPPYFLKAALHRLAHFALADDLVSDLGELRAAHSEPDVARPKVGYVPDREAGEGTDRE